MQEVIPVSETQTHVHHFLEESADRFPDKVALIHEDVRLTYAQINAQANQMANRLIEQGIKKGDRLVLILNNCLEYIVSYYGGLKIGAILVPLGSDLQPEGLRPILKELEPGVIVSSSRFERLLQATDLTPYNIQSLILIDPKFEWPPAGFQVYSWADIIGDGDCPNPNLAIEETALASIIYTSGSTGKPKGVMLTHKNIVHNTHSICQYLHLTEKDIQMTVLSFHYVMGKSLLNTHFAVGGTMVINNKFAFVASVVKQMAAEKVTGFSGVPATFAYLLHRSPLESYRDRLGSLRYVSQAGGHMAKKTKLELRRVLPAETDIVIMYGATEASARLTYLEPARFADKLETIGVVIPGVTMRVLDENGQELPDGQVGELVAAGDNIMQGYWQDKEATDRALDEHGYHSGDLGYRDEEGFFYVVGRKDNLLKVSGHRINPQQVEDALYETELIIEAVVFGVADELKGHKLVAVVTPKDKDCDENLIMSRLSELLPTFKLPSMIKLVRALPKNTSSKIDRLKCRDLI